jgi:hypothetical protein
VPALGLAAWLVPKALARELDERDGCWYAWGGCWVKFKSGARAFIMFRRGPDGTSHTGLENGRTVDDHDRGPDLR